MVHGLAGLGSVQGLQWSADGLQLLIKGKDHFAVLGQAELLPLLQSGGGSEESTPVDVDLHKVEKGGLDDSISIQISISSPKASSVFVFDPNG